MTQSISELIREKLSDLINADDKFSNISVDLVAEFKNNTPDKEKINTLLRSVVDDENC
jgi:hypothetical protein